MRKIDLYFSLTSVLAYTIVPLRGRNGVPYDVVFRPSKERLVNSVWLRAWIGQTRQTS